MFISHPLSSVPPSSDGTGEYQPAGQRSGSHADSVWPYLDEARRLVAGEGARPDAVTALDSSWLQKLLAYLRGESEVS